MHHAAYFYLEMHTHELTVPYTNKPRRIRVLLPRITRRTRTSPILFSTSMTARMSSTAANPSVATPGKSFPPSRRILTSPK